MNIITGNDNTDIKIPAEVMLEIERAIRVRAKAKSMEEAAKGLNVQAKDTLLPLLTAYDIKSYALPGIGIVSGRVSAGSTINAKKLTAALLLAGIAADEIERLIAQSSTHWKTPYVDFRQPKREV